MGLEKSAEVILRLLTTTEGPNLKLSCRDFNCDVKGDVAIETEMFWNYIQRSGRNSRDWR